MPVELQSALIVISAIIIIASLLFAGYIFIKNDKSGRIGAQTDDNNIMSRSGDNTEPAEKTAAALMPAGDLVEKHAVPERDNLDPLQITDLKIEPATARTGEKILISFTATNMDRSHTQYGVILKIDGMVFTTTEVRILPGLSLHMDFQVFLLAPGTHTADVNGSTGVFTIVK